MAFRWGRLAGASGSGPDSAAATKVTISNKFRVALRAAGVSANEIIRINLNDKAAVAAAIQKARLAHSKPVVKPASKPAAKAEETSKKSESTKPQSTDAVTFHAGTHGVDADVGEDGGRKSGADSDPGSESEASGGAERAKQAS